MKLTIDSTVIDKYNMTVQEFLTLMLVIHRVNLNEAKKALISKGYVISTIDFDSGTDFERTKLGVDTYNNIILESSPQNMATEERLKNLATKLKEIYPKGKKDGTWYWADGVAVIARRLQIFFHKYDKKMELTDDQIINATKRYVEEKQAQPDMRLLKYFIFKEAVGKGGDVEPTSDLLTYIENEGQQSHDADEAFITLV